MEKKFLMKGLKLKNNELIERARKLQDGVPFATPVFDGAMSQILINFLT